MSKFWSNLGKIVKDSLGRIVSCATCPCGTAPTPVPTSCCPNTGTFTGVPSTLHISFASNPPGGDCPNAGGASITGTMTYTTGVDVNGHSLNGWLITGWHVSVGDGTNVFTLTYFLYCEHDSLPTTGFHWYYNYKVEAFSGAAFCYGGATGTAWILPYDGSTHRGAPLSSPVCDPFSGSLSNDPITPAGVCCGGAADNIVLLVTE